MLREIDLKEISDGRLYRSSDMAKTDCGGCEGCSACCHGMGSSIVLDPLDIHRLCTGIGKTFEELLARSIELNVVDGIVLPNLKMAGTGESCSFLNTEGRCGIHAHRPGICRLFPLGRFYEDGSFQYFVQIHECPNPNKSKVKIRKWIDTPDIKKYEQYISDWHYYLKNLQEQVLSGDVGENVKELSMQVLKIFYLAPYDTGRDFYEEFYGRLRQAL